MLKRLALVILTAYFFLPCQPIYADNIYILQIDDAPISPVTTEYILTNIEKAENDKAVCVILKMDTPGGLLTSTRLIVKKILSSQVPVIVYVYPSGSRAGSAGVFITYASHIAAMAPSTNIGAAHPVELGGRQKQAEQRTFWDALKDSMDEARERRKSKSEEDQETTSRKLKPSDNEIKKPGQQKAETDDPMNDKILNDTVAFIKAIAKERNRNIEWAEMSVTRSLSITEKEALDKGVIEIVAASEDDLISQLDGKKVKMNQGDVILKTKGASRKYIDLNSRQKFLNILANPNIAYIFFILGFYGLLYEITHPGVGLPGILGTIFLILAFYSMQMLPVNYAGLALIILAIILFIAEAKVAGWGLLTLGGVVCMVLGSLMLFDTSVPDLRVSISLVLSFTLTTAAITLFLVKLAVSTHRKKVLSGKEGLIGETGEAQDHIGTHQEGKVFVHGEIWNAVSQDALKKGDKITVLEIDGLTLRVKRKV